VPPIEHRKKKSTALTLGEGFPQHNVAWNAPSKLTIYGINQDE